MHILPLFFLGNATRKFRAFPGVAAPVSTNCRSCLDKLSLLSRQIVGVRKEQKYQSSTKKVPTCHLVRVQQDKN
jgi:hypothetical protein